MAIRTTALPCAVLGLAVGIFCGEAAVGQPAEQGTRLVDFASSGAVFSRGGELILVQVGEEIDGTAARLLHVGLAEIRIEYSASNQSVGGVMVLNRESAVPTLWPAAESPREPIPLITVTDVAEDPVKGLESTSAAQTVKQPDSKALRQ